MCREGDVDDGSLRLAINRGKGQSIVVIVLRLMNNAINGRGTAAQVSFCMFMCVCNGEKHTH